MTPRQAAVVISFLAVLLLGYALGVLSLVVGVRTEHEQPREVPPSPPPPVVRHQDAPHGPVRGVSEIEDHLQVGGLFLV